ncbi:hypothetical protein EYF80_009024 [Liparis tanakae]|uniref:Uncharacterized protein n=1 Tax=Liparis tanakae TaxID=230148 RepID=A0A4Z2IS02_9TELE|nr:hypothetical protein EYF80_009024 [Liparis tanakae]
MANGVCGQQAEQMDGGADLQRVGWSNTPLSHHAQAPHAWLPHQKPISYTSCHCQRRHESSS